MQTYVKACDYLELDTILFRLSPACSWPRAHPLPGPSWLLLPAQHSPGCLEAAGLSKWNAHVLQNIKAPRWSSTRSSVTNQLRSPCIDGHWRVTNHEAGQLGKQDVWEEPVRDVAYSSARWGRHLGMLKLLSWNNLWYSYRFNNTNTPQDTMTMKTIAEWGFLRVFFSFTLIIKPQQIRAVYIQGEMKCWAG